MIFKPGQIYFWNSNKDLFGKAITYYNKKKFGASFTTHCGIITNVSEDAVTIWEATEKGFKPSIYEKWWLETRIAEGKVFIGETKERIKDFVIKEDYLNIGYGWLDILAIGASFLFGYKIIGITGKNRLICSEAVCRVLYDCSKTIDFQKEYGIKFDAITPMHIFMSRQIDIVSNLKLIAGGVKHE